VLAKNSADNKENQETSWHLAIDTPDFLAKYFAYKGSISD
jgi:hypothetical protein